MMTYALILFAALSIPHGRIAFVVHDGKQADIATIWADGRGFEKVSDTRSAEEAAPAWSPSGKMLVYGSNKEGNSEVYLYLLDSKRTVRVTKTPEAELFPQFMPSGTRISFERWHGNELKLPSLWSISLYGTQAIKLSPHAFNHSWSMLNSDAVYMTPKGITTSDRVGRRARTVLPPVINAHMPQWSPNSSRLAFTAIAKGQTDLYVVDASGQGLKNITKSELIEESPTWSPNGSTIAYVTRWPSAESTTRLKELRRKIRIIDIKTRKRQTLTDGSKECFSPTWSPDGSGLAFVCCSIFPACKLYVADIPAKTMRPIVERTMAYSDPSWSPELVFRNLH